MNTPEARQFGSQLASLAKAGRFQGASTLLAPVLLERTTFRLLDLIGAGLGEIPFKQALPVLDAIASTKTIGSWPLIGSALQQYLASQLEDALSQCCVYIQAGDAWHAADTLAERVAGPAMVFHFDQAIVRLSSWREHPNRWVRRGVGVAVHLWAKRSRGARDKDPQVRLLLEFLAPMLAEQDQDTAKGIGWGLKTIGRFYPEQLTDWLRVQIKQSGYPKRRLVLRKALTYLPPNLRQQALILQP